LDRLGFLHLRTFSMTFRFNILLALAAVGIAFSAATSQAAIVVGLNNIKYADYEQLATYNNTTHTYTAVNPLLTQIAVGDHFYGVSEATVESPDNSPPHSASVFELVIAKIIDPTTGAALTPAAIAGFTGYVEVLFTSDSALVGGVGGVTGGFLTGSSGTTYTLVNGDTVSGLGQTLNTMDAVYQGSTINNPTIQDPELLANQATGITHASNGTLYSDFGYGGGAAGSLNDTSANSSWGAAGTGYWATDIFLVGGLQTIGVATSTFGLGLQSLTLPNSDYLPLLNPVIGSMHGGEGTGTDGTNIHNNNGLTPLGPPASLTPVGFTLTGQGNATVGFPGPWPVQSSDPFNIDPQAPEPGTMLLMGMGVVFGVPYLRRRRKAAA
jgi:hypothetical protein